MPSKIDSRLCYINVVAAYLPSGILEVEYKRLSVLLNQQELTVSSMQVVAEHTEIEYLSALIPIGNLGLMFHVNLNLPS